MPVYIRKRVGRRRSFLRKHKALMLFLVGTGAFILSFIATRIARNPSAILPFSAKVAVNAPKVSPDFKVDHYQRVVYPYSVIPGGVRSREELADKIGSDRIVADHYADFKVGQSWMTKAEKAEFVYVSYRLENKVYWTQKPVKIPKGEMLITDGRDTARARCGNKVAVSPQAPVSEDEPAIETLDIPVIAMLEPPLGLNSVPESELEFREIARLEPLIPAQQSAILPYYYRPLFVVRPQGPEVPEPGTLGLLAAGLAALFATRFARKK
jgi:hypothetical protein